MPQGRAVARRVRPQTPPEPKSRLRLRLPPPPLTQPLEMPAAKANRKAGTPKSLFRRFERKQTPKAGPPLPSTRSRSHAHATYISKRYPRSPAKGTLARALEIDRRALKRAPRPPSSSPVKGIHISSSACTYKKGLRRPPPQGPGFAVVSKFEPMSRCNKQSYAST